MAITPNNPADFDPAMGNYRDLKPFRYWCQKALPLVYDDSLSYYEVLCKVVDYLNKAMEDIGVLHDDVDALHTAYQQLQSYVNDYFSTLDVQQEINNKLDVMASDGTLDALLLPYFNAYKGEINGIIADQNANIQSLENTVNTSLSTQNQNISALSARMDTFASLPDGSTAGDAELLDIRIGEDGEIYPSAGTAVRSQVGTLKYNIIGGDNGYEYFDLYGVFQNGAIINGEFLPQYSYRASTNTIMTFDRDITVDVTTGYLCCAFYFVNGEYVNNSGNQATTFVIQAGKSFKLEIRKATETTGVQANIKEFVRAIKIRTHITEEIGNIKSEIIDARIGEDGEEYNSVGSAIRSQASVLKDNIEVSSKGYEYFTLFAHFQNGAIIDGELLPQYKYRVSTDNIMSFNEDVSVSIDEGFYICAFYFEGDTYVNNSGNIANSFTIPTGKNFKLEIRKITETPSVEANVKEFVSAVKINTLVGKVIDDYNNGLALTLSPLETYDGYFKLNGTPLIEDTTIKTQKFIIPTGTTRIAINTNFYGLTGVAFSDVEDPVVTALGYPSNCTKDPLTAYASLTNVNKTYNMDRYYKYVYIPYYVPSGTPKVKAYRDSAFDTFFKGIHPLENKNVLIFGDSMVYTRVRWRESFFNLTRAKELAAISQVGAHLTDYNTWTPLDGNYMSTADDNVHNVVCNQVYWWLNNTPTEIEPDVIIISAGTNDVKSNEELAVDTNVYTDETGWIDVDTVNRTTFEGAMRWIASKLRERYVHAVIVFASPIQSAESIHHLENQLAKEDKMVRVCKHLSANIITATSGSGISGEFEVANGQGRYLLDGLHPNELGGYLLGEYYATSLETQLKNI